MVKFGHAKGVQLYRCKCCKRTQRHEYSRNAYKSGINKEIVAHVKEGCDIRSISRLLNIAANTVLRRIKSITDSITKPIIPLGHQYEVDELKTYVNWVIYA